MTAMTPGTLYLVATPIGNLADITHRALQVLKDVDLIACEDTRHTHKLLNHYGITTKTISYHEHNEQQRAAQLIERLKQGSDIAVVSDAGTPSISDPGFRLVRAAIENEIPVVPVPGPSALISALIAAGLPTDEFFFAGFLAITNECASCSFERIAIRAGHVDLLRIAASSRGDTQRRLRDSWRARSCRRKGADETTRGDQAWTTKRVRRGLCDQKNDIRGEIVVLIDRNVIGAASEPET